MARRTSVAEINQPSRSVSGIPTRQLLEESDLAARFSPPATSASSGSAGRQGRRSGSRADGCNPSRALRPLARLTKMLESAVATCVGVTQGLSYAPEQAHAYAGTFPSCPVVVVVIGDKNRRLSSIEGGRMTAHGRAERQAGARHLPSRVRARAGPEPRRRNGARRSRGARRLPRRPNVYRSSVGLLILAKTFHPTRSVRASPVRGPSKEEDR